MWDTIWHVLVLLLLVRAGSPQVVIVKKTSDIHPDSSFPDLHFDRPEAPR
jgi:hypothetical protein